MFSTANGVMFCDIYPQSTAHITTDPPLIYSFYFHVLFNRSSILDPDFPVNLEVLLIMIIFFFSTTEVISTLSSDRILGPTRSGKAWYGRPFTHCLYFICKHKFYACTHVKITRQWILDISSIYKVKHDFTS